MEKTKYDAAVQMLLDKQEINEQLVRYTRACDRVDEAALRAVFFPDATVQYSGFKGAVAAGFFDWLLGLIKSMQTTVHMISNVLIEVEGDRAYVETYLLSYKRMTREGKEYDRMLGGRYVDRFERRDGAWKIANRQIVFEWNRNDPPSGSWTLSHAATDMLVGRRWPEDTIYKR